MLTTNPPAPTATLPAERDIPAPANAVFPSAQVLPRSSTPLLLSSPSSLSPHLDPSLLSLKSAAAAALAEIFAAKDADFREKRLAASIVFEYAASVEPRPQRTRSASEELSAKRPSSDIDDDDFDSDLEDTNLDESECDDSELENADSLADSDDSDDSDDPEHSASEDPIDSDEDNPSPSRLPVPRQWANQLRDDEVILSTFVADPPKIPRHITDNHHVQHLQRLCYNHGYWSGFHNYKGTQQPPYPISYRRPRTRPSRVQSEISARPRPPRARKRIARRRSHRAIWRRASPGLNRLPASRTGRRASAA